MGIIQLDVGDLHRFQSENKSLKTFESAATTVKQQQQQQQIRIRTRRTKKA